MAGAAVSLFQGFITDSVPSLRAFWIFCFWRYVTDVRWGFSCPRDWHSEWSREYCLLLFFQVCVPFCLPAHRVSSRSVSGGSRLGWLQRDLSSFQVRPLVSHIQRCPPATLPQHSCVLCNKPRAHRTWDVKNRHHYRACVVASQGTVRRFGVSEIRVPRVQVGIFRWQYGCVAYF